MVSKKHLDIVAVLTKKDLDDPKPAPPAPVPPAPQPSK